MDIEKLIKLADLLDSRGEYEAASEIDELIKKAIGDEPTDPNINAPRFTDEEPTQPSMPMEMEEEPTEPDIDWEAEGKWDEEETEKMINAFDAAVNEAKKLLNMATSYPYLIQLHATGEVSRATEELKKMSAYIKNQLRMAREGDMADDLPYLPETRPDKFELPTLPETEPEEFTLPTMPESKPEKFELPMLAHTFEQLSKIADDLDVVGARKEADMIDRFIEKHAEEFGPDTPEYNEALRSQMGKDIDRDSKQAANQIEDKMIALNVELTRLERYLPEELDSVVGDLREVLTAAMGSVDDYLKKIDMSQIPEGYERDIYLKPGEGYRPKRSSLQRSAIFELPESPGIRGLKDIDWGGDKPVFRSDEDEEEWYWGEEGDEEEPSKKYEEDADEYMDERLGDEELVAPTEEEAEEEMGKIREKQGPFGPVEPGKLRHYKANVKNNLSKRANEYSEDRKEEGDTEQSKRYDSKHHHSLQVREPKRDQERVDREGRKEHHVETYKKTEAHHLSTRYCPEHIGTQMGRVGEGTYQCPLDGQVYNWETGWTDFDGNQHPGGSVAAQTPDSTGYAIPHRIFDSREKVLNVVN